MRKIILSMSVSLDGYFEGPDHDISWHRVDEEVHEDANAFLRTMGAFVQGRVTHELMAEFWPTADEDPECPAPMADFAGIWREMPKIVYSRTLDPSAPEATAWHTTVVPDVVADEVMALKAQPGGDLSLGGADLTASFLRLDLVDEFRIYIHPVLVGRGTQLFPAADTMADLRLLRTRVFANGVILAHYERIRD